MDAGLTPDERKAFEAAMLRVHELRVELERVEDALNAASESGDDSAQIDAIAEVLRTTEALENAWLDAGRWGIARNLIPSQADVAREKLAFRQEMRALLPIALDRLIDIAFLSTTDPEKQQVRSEAKRILLQSDLVTAHELETFPKESLQSIIAERYREWDEEN